MLHVAYPVRHLMQVDAVEFSLEVNLSDNIPDPGQPMCRLPSPAQDPTRRRLDCEVHRLTARLHPGHVTNKYSRIGHYGGYLTDSQTQHHCTGYYLASPLSSEDRSSRPSVLFSRCRAVFGRDGRTWSGSFCLA